MKNGILYTFFKLIFDNFRFLTLVEFFKFLAKKINPKKNNLDYKLLYSRNAVDIFMLLKWMFILIIARFSYSNNFVLIIVWYLLITNIYSYFYYHIWSDEALNTSSFEKDRIRRRFLNLILAIGFSNFCFAYLYKLPYHLDFNWSNNIITFQKAIWFSLSNSIGGNYNAVKPINDFSNSVSMIQLIITFIFITIIVGKSIPQTNSKK